MSTTSTPPSVDTRDMLVVHTAVRREFRLAPGLVREASGGAAERRTTVADHLDFLLEFLHHHHTGEDRLLWPLLLERVPEELAPVVRSMEEQHEAIAAVSGEAEALLPSWRATGEGGEQLAGLLQRLHDLLDEHLGVEEREVLPLAARTLTPAEWGRLGEEGMASVERTRLPLVLGMFMYEGDPATIRSMLSHAPLVPRLLMPHLAPRAYARYARRVHLTARP